MAHRLAELMDESDRGSLEAKSEASQLILDIWQRREFVPFRAAPLRRFDEIFAVLERIDRQADLHSPIVNDALMPESAAAFDTVAAMLVRINVLTGALSARLITELQLVAEREDIDWQTFALDLGTSKADDGVRLLMNRLLSKHESAEVRRELIVDLLADIDRYTALARTRFGALELVDGSYDSARPSLQENEGDAFT